MKKSTLDLISLMSFCPSNIGPSQIVIDLISQRLHEKKELSLSRGMKTEKRRKDRPLLGFRDHKKVDGTPNITFMMMVVTATIAHHSVAEIPIDDKNFCDLMHLKIFRKLGLHIQDLKFLTFKVM